MDELACFSEASRQRAFERFEFLRAHLEDGRPLAAIAREAKLSYRTLQYWLERYRTYGLVGLVQHHYFLSRFPMLKSRAKGSLINGNSKAACLSWVDALGRLLERDQFVFIS